MASPQIENGFTSVANEIMDALCKCHPGGSEGQILWAIIRKTYGWHKKKDAISISQLSELTGVSRRMVIYAVKNLEAKNMLTVERNHSDGFNTVNIISFQKDYTKWVVQEIDGSARKSRGYRLTIQKQKESYKNRVVQEIDGSARNGKRVVQDSVNDIPFLAPTKETITKETITKEIGENGVVAEKGNAKKAADKYVFVLPEWVPAQAWNAFVEMRKTIKKPLTEWGKHLAVLDLQRISGSSGDTPEEILNESTYKNYQGLFPVKRDGGGNGSGNRFGKRDHQQSQPETELERSARLKTEEWYRNQAAKSTSQ